MKVYMNEIGSLKEYMGMDMLGEFICNLEESNSDYENVIEEIILDYKHKVVEALREAIYCGFDREVLSIDCGISSDLIDTMLKYQDKEIEIEL